MGLAEAMQGAVGQPASVRVGLIDSVNPLVISAEGVPFEDVGVLGGFVGNVGDPVILLGQCSASGSDPASWVALGSLAAGGLLRNIACVVQRNAALPVATGFGDTFVPFDAEIFDPFGMFTATSTSVIVPVDGVYQINVRAAFAGNATGVRIGSIGINGANTSREQILTSVGAGLFTSVAVSDGVLLNAGDTVHMVVKQTSGVSLNVGTAWMSVALASGA